MKNIKLIVFDVGNTLIETKKGLTVSKQVLEDLKELKSKGYFIGLSTLRTKKMILPILKQYCFDFLILMNGGLVFINDNVVYSQPLSNGLIKKIKSQADICNATVIDYEYNGQIYALELPFAKDKFTVSDEYQAYVWKKSGNIDITPKGVTKTQGLLTVLSEYDILPSEVLTFGDGYNDIEMLKMSGISVAMGGAPKEVSDVATITTLSAGEDGISVALRKLEIL